MVKLAEIKLKNSLVEAQRFRKALDRVPAYIYMKDSQFRYIYANRQTLGLFACSAEELSGIDDRRFFPEDTAKRLREIDLRVLMGEHTIEEIDVADTDSGRRVYWEMKTPIYAEPEDHTICGILGISTDITARKQAEVELRESEKELQLLLKSMINAFVLFESIFDENGDFISYRFVYINEAYERVTGVKNEEVKGKSVHEVWPETEAEWIRRYGEVAVTGVSSEFELYHDSTKKLYHCNVYRPWNENRRFCVVFEDISERKQAKEEIKRQLAEKEGLLKEVHHRIKNNIAAIGGLISLRLQTVSNPEAATVLKEALVRVDNMRLLYDKLLLNEDYKIISVKNYLEDLTDSIVALFPDQAKIKLERQITDFHLDAKRLFPLGSIINELLTNTMKYAFISRKTGSIKIFLGKVGNSHAHCSGQRRRPPARLRHRQGERIRPDAGQNAQPAIGRELLNGQAKGHACTLEFDI